MQNIVVVTFADGSVRRVPRVDRVEATENVLHIHQSSPKGMVSFPLSGIKSWSQR